MKKPTARLIRPLLAVSLVFSSVAVTTPLWSPTPVYASVSAYQTDVNRYNSEVVAFYERYYASLETLEEAEYMEDYVVSFLALKQEYHAFLLTVNTLANNMNVDMQPIHRAVKEMVQVDYELVNSEYLYYMDELDEDGYDKRYDEWDALYDSTLEATIQQLKTYSETHGVLHSPAIEELLGEPLNVAKPMVPVLPNEPVVVGESEHVVVKGDTLYSLSRQYNVSVAMLKEANGMQVDGLSIGQVLHIPETVKDSLPSYAYVVVKGDTFYSIAKRNGLSVAELQTINGVNHTNLSIGQVLQVVKTHVVQKGDTLYSLSRAYGVTVDKVKEWNGLTHTTLTIGQTLVVSGKN